MKSTQQSIALYIIALLLSLSMFACVVSEKLIQSAIAETETAIAQTDKLVQTAIAQTAGSRPTESKSVLLTSTIALSLSPTPLLPPTHTPIQSTPTPKLVAQINDRFGVSMVLVPSGAFEMGSDVDEALAECEKLYIGGDCTRSWFENEEPVHTVVLDNFYMDQYEVTNAEFAGFLFEQGNRMESGTTWLDSKDENALIVEQGGYWQPKSGYENHPVIEVTWFGARAYCEWRDARLPTEAEWEKAARGGLQGKLYSWGNDFDDERVNFCDQNCPSELAFLEYDDGYSDTAPVGSYESNGYGLYDMAGNVWEWVADWYAADYYQNSPDDYPQGPTQGEYRVLRGGSWLSSIWYVQSAYRGWFDPSDTRDRIGFRCARSPGQEQTSAPPQTSTPKHINTPTQEQVRELYLNHLGGFALFYDTNAWTETEGDFGKIVLVSLEISGCTIEEQGPTEPVPITGSIQVGDIYFDVFEFEDITNNQYGGWFLALDGFENPQPGTIPVFIVKSVLSDADKCLLRVYTVLETLHAANP